MIDPDRKSAVPVPRLKDALREARIELAERTGVVVDLHNAEIARLEILNEALDPVFADIPEQVELFDRGIIPGDRRVSGSTSSPMWSWRATSASIVSCRTAAMAASVLARIVIFAEIARAVTKYVARRLVERERALEGDTSLVTYAASGAAAQKAPPLAFVRHVPYRRRARDRRPARRRARGHAANCQACTVSRCTSTKPSRRRSRARSLRSATRRAFPRYDRDYSRPDRAVARASRKRTERRKRECGRRVRRARRASGYAHGRG